MGKYDFRNNAITINRALDKKSVPIYAIEFIMYHEALHLKMGVVKKNGKNYGHTPEFRQAEKEYCDYEKANQFFERFKP